MMKAMVGSTVTFALMQMKVRWSQHRIILYPQIAKDYYKINPNKKLVKSTMANTV